MMRHVVRRWFGGAAVIAMVGLIAASCTKETTVFVERPLFEDPPAGANGFLGYQSNQASDAGVTVCGNCHVGSQTNWSTAGHAEAWENLEVTGSAQDFCRECHSTGPNGNPPTNDATDGGWVSTGDERYYDVQCEACHGPGETHLDDPGAFQPLASAAVDTAFGCGDCHQGDHHGFVDEWLVSPHAQIVDFAAAREGCADCHNGKATIQLWDPGANYVEKDDGTALPQVCVVCHDPHNSPYTAQLRQPIENVSIQNHLCAQCHNRRTEPDPGSSHGLEPHAPEADLLQGTAGWVPPGSFIGQDTIAGTHGSTANPRACAACHVFAYTVRDEVTGDFVFNATGHLFRPIPCVDAQGVPEPFDVTCGLSTSERSYASCTVAGCHGSEQAAFAALTTKAALIQRDADDLIALLALVDPNLEAPGGEIDPTDPTFTVAEGAFFNHALAEFGNPTFNTDNVLGSTTHNPFLIQSLLLESINIVQSTYGVSLPQTVGRDFEAEVRAEIAKARGY